MNNVSAILQNKIITLMESFRSLEIECKDIYDGYWKTDANTNVTGLSGDNDGATYDTKLTKVIYINAITLCEELNDFLQNGTVTESDYLQSAIRAVYADAATPAKLSEATEEIGDRIRQLCLDVIENYKQSKEIQNIYNDNEISDCVAVLDNEREFFGSDMTRSDLSSALTFCIQFVNFMTNQTVTEGDYSATLNKWKKYETISY